MPRQSYHERLHNLEVTLTVVTRWHGQRCRHIRLDSHSEACNMMYIGRDDDNEKIVNKNLYL